MISLRVNIGFVWDFFRVEVVQYFWFLIIIVLFLFSCFITKDYKKPLKFNSFICFFFFILSIYTLDKKNDVRILLWKQGKKIKKRWSGEFVMVHVILK